MAFLNKLVLYVNLHKGDIPVYHQTILPQDYSPMASLNSGGKDPLSFLMRVWCSRGEVHACRPPYYDFIIMSMEYRTPMQHEEDDYIHHTMSYVHSCI